MLAGNLETPIYSSVVENFGTNAFTYQIPNNAIGKLSIATVGFDDEGMLGYDTLEIIIKIPSNVKLDSIVPIPQLIYVNQNDTSYFNLMGYYSDGLSRPIIINNNVSFSGNDLTIAQHILNNRILGLSIDTTIFNISYSGKTTQMFVKVIEPLNSQTTGVEQIHSETNHNINLYPNPTNNKSTLSYELSEKSEIDIEIYNMVGQKIKTIFSGSEYAGAKEKEIDLSNFSDGIYFYTIRINNNSQTGKIMKAN